MSDKLTLEESEDERLRLCIEIGQQMSEIWRLQAQRDALLATIKAALPIFVNRMEHVEEEHSSGEDTEGRAAIDALRAVIAKAEGRDA